MIDFYIGIENEKLQQVVAEIQEKPFSQKLKQVDSELNSPKLFAFIPWILPCSETVRHQTFSQAQIFTILC